ncbi:response regulator [Paenibacillus sp. OAS669]|uniref:response regulator n=1 Tax=Paenibacillus sp. OAS669 TaxID=2663821 RepID=UPI00178A972E|nr:response regulator transcription factor [Paenibacillus sp. OAS669]MBE1441318.1 two-component system response regulator YesN [Paenibacillus sp. OAS669]
MYKVLLVDDEMYVRKGLMSLIDWEQLGYVIAGEAENGQEALELIKELEPDLVIIDIRMPVLDGLDVIRTVAEQEGSQPSFIIISGYHDFKYAQQALRYGVVDYILKPIDEEELQGTLLKLCDTINMKKLTRISKGRRVGGSVLELLIQGQVKQEDEPELLSALRMEGAARFCCALIELRLKGDTLPAPRQEHVIDCILQVFNVPGMSVDRIPLIQHADGKYSLLIHYAWLESFDQRLEISLRALQGSLTKLAQGTVTIFAGKPVSRLTEVRESFVTAGEAAQYQFAMDGETVIMYEQVQGIPLYALDIDAELYKQLMDQLEEQDQEALLRTVDHMFHQFQYKRFAPRAIGNTIARCVISVIQLVKELEGDEKPLTVLPEIMQWQQMNITLKELKELLVRFLVQASEYLDQLRKEQSKGSIHKVKKYIETHYAENVSLKSMAAAFYMNPAYLGQLFRKTYGVYFNDFLLQLRIDEAKKLLRQTDLRIYEIAQTVGFQNADYFVTQFEKRESVTPTEYRNKIIGH